MKQRICWKCWTKRNRMETPAARAIDGFDWCIPCALEDGYEATDGEAIVAAVTAAERRTAVEPEVAPTRATNQAPAKSSVATPAESVKAPKRNGSNGNGKHLPAGTPGNVGLTVAGQKMRLAQASHELRIASPVGGHGVYLGEEHLDAWWHGLSAEGKFDFFSRVMFPGVPRQNTRLPIARKAAN